MNSARLPGCLRRQVAQPLRPLMESVMKLHDMPGIELSLVMAQEAAIEADEDQLRRLLVDPQCAMNMATGEEAL